MYCKEKIVKKCLVASVLVCTFMFLGNDIPNCGFYQTEVMAKGNTQTASPWDDDVQEVDFKPYMNDLQKRILKYWNPSKENKTNNVVLSLRIAKDGSLLSSNVVKSSGSQSTDKEALNAAQKASPFSPLPTAFTGESVDIQFSFDYTNRGKIGQRYKKDYLQY